MLASQSVRYTGFRSAVKVEVFFRPLLIGDIVLWTRYLRVCRRGERETEFNGRGDRQHMPELASSSIGKLANAGNAGNDDTAERRTPNAKRDR